MPSPFINGLPYTEGEIMGIRGPKNRNNISYLHDIQVPKYNGKNIIPPHSNSEGSYTNRKRSNNFTPSSSENANSPDITPRHQRKNKKKKKRKTKGKQGLRSQNTQKQNTRRERMKQRKIQKNKTKRRKKEMNQKQYNSNQ